MCLAIPMLLVSIDGHLGKAELDGIGRDVMLDLVPEARVGDYVIVHAGFAIQTLDEDSARETLSLLAQLGETPE